jgi:hypothetical protein
VVVLVPNLGIDLPKNLDEPVGLTAAILKEATEDLVVRREAYEGEATSKCMVDQRDRMIHVNQTCR